MEKPPPNDTGEGRRRFMKVMAAGSAAAFLPGCNPTDTPTPATEAEEAPAFFKDTAPFIPHGNTNLEARQENFRGFLTPAEHFFVRNNASSIAVDAAGYTLQVEGDAVESPLTLSLDDLLQMPSRTVFSYIECGGNQRAFFGTLLGQPARGTQWGRGAVGMAVWTGVPLSEVLTRAGIRDTAVDVQLIGLDTDAPEDGFRRPIPKEKCLIGLRTVHYTLLFLMVVAGSACSKTTPQTSEAQRAEGDALYQAYCASCHEVDQGIGPRLSRNVLATRVSVKRLFTYNRKNMPYNAGNTLTEAEYWAITAYLLAREGLFNKDVVLDAASAEGVMLR